jgi:hypothetical protein
VIATDESSVGKTWIILFREGFMDYCILVVWQVGNFGGLVESSFHSSMLSGRFPTLWMDFQWLLIVSCDECILGSLAWMR